MNVYIAQLKCPSNHCILAAAGEYETEEAAQVLWHKVKKRFDDLIERKLADPGCGLCGSRIFHVDLMKTRFETMEEAKPYLIESGLRQTATSLIFKALHDSRN